MLSKFFKRLGREKLRKGFSAGLILFLVLGGVFSETYAESTISPYDVQRISSQQLVLKKFKACLNNVKGVFKQVEIKGLTDELQIKLKREMTELVVLDRKVARIFTRNANLVSHKKLSQKAMRRLSYRCKLAFARYTKQFQRLISVSIRLLKEPINKPAEFYHSIMVRIKRLKWLESTLPKSSFDLKKLPIKAPVFSPRSSFDGIINKIKKPEALSDYLVKTEETRLSPQIEEQAAKLDHNPYKILAWVNLNIRNLPIPGSLWGAGGCLKEGSGSPLDRASLLVALLRASEIPSRYVFGMTQAGSQEELRAAAEAGMPVNGQARGRIWVEARIMGKNQGWIPLVLSSFSPAPEKPLKPDFKLAEKGIEHTWKLSRKMLGEALKLKDPVPASFNQFPGVSKSLTAGKLPFKVIGRPIKTAVAPESLRYSVKLRLINEKEKTVDISWSSLNTARQGVSLVYLPADQCEVDIIKRLGELEKTEYVSPSYLIKLKTYLIVGRKEIISGPISTLGSEQTLTLTVTGPGGFKEKAVHNLRVGMHSYLAFNFGNILGEPEPGITDWVIAWVMDMFMDMGWYEDMSDMGEGYLRQTRLIDRYLAVKYRVSLDNLFSESLVSQSAEIETLLGIPVSFAYNGTRMDIQKELLLPAGKQDRPWIRVKALMASALEEKVLSSKLKGPALSTLSLLKEYPEKNVSVLHITAQNLSASLARLKHSRGMISLVKQAVLSGGEVTIPCSVPEGSEIGYIVTNAQGDSGYYMSNGLGAGQTGLIGSMNTTASVTMPKRTLPMIIALVLVLGVMVFIVVAVTG